MTYVITQPCCKDAACIPVCPVDCIHPTTDGSDFAAAESLYIDPAACVDCGACAEVCPVQAIVPDHELAERDQHYAEFASRYFAEVGRRERRPIRRKAAAPSGSREVIKVAIVGSGPSACYAALELLAAEGIEAEISLFERLPAFGGLVRYGVAPDHQSTKLVAENFERALSARNVRMFLNVEVGRHVSVEELAEFHHAVIFSTGAGHGRTLGIPGEELRGAISASEFVGWYNGHPDYAALAPNLEASRAVIVGNGNVALDVARVLLGDEDMRRSGDMADHARAALAASRIEEVVVMGRRGPAATAGTTPELAAFADMPGVRVILDTSPGDASDWPRGDGFAERLKVLTLQQLAAGRSSEARRRLVFKYYRAPLAIYGDGAVERVVTAVTRQATATATEVIDCGLLISAVGYRGAPIEGVPFDAATGALRNRGGRICDEQGSRVPGLYAAGWVKRGPSGVIGTNRQCAAETVGHLLDDFRAGRLSPPTSRFEELDRLIGARQPDRVDHAGWRRIDQFERSRAEPGQVRRKLITRAELVAVAAAVAR